MALSALVLAGNLLLGGPFAGNGTTNDPCEAVFGSSFEAGEAIPTSPCARLSGFIINRSGTTETLAPGVPVTARIAADPDVPYAQSQSSAGGEFGFPALPSDQELVIAVEPSGLLTGPFGGSVRLFPSSRRVTLASGVETRLDFAITGSYANPFDPTMDAQLTQFGSGDPSQPRAGEVEVPGNALVKADGNPPEGGATLFLIPIDVSMPQSSAFVAGADVFPGTMAASNASGADTSLQSFGAMAIEFFDNTGAPLNLASGQSATIRIPVPAEFRAGAPDQIPLWWFDVTSGLWREEGQAQIAADRSFYEGAVGHFTNWNADIPAEVADVTGQVQFDDGSAVAGAWLELTGTGYGFRTMSIAGPDGFFELRARRGFPVSIEVSARGFKQQFPGIPIANASVSDIGILQLATGPRDPNDRTARLEFPLSAFGAVSIYFAPGVLSYEFHGVSDADVFIYHVQIDSFNGLRVEPPFGGEGGGTNPPPPFNFGIQRVDGSSFEQLTEAPADGYMRDCFTFGDPDPNCVQLMNPYNLTPVDGAVYAVRNRAGFFSKFTVLDAQQDGSGGWTVTLRHQSNSTGGRNF